MTTTEFIVEFDRRALREWKKLDRATRNQFGKKLCKLATCEEAPSPKDRLRGFDGSVYKIKARGSGYRLVYEYQAGRLVILVVAIGKRNRSLIYNAATKRLNG